MPNVRALIVAGLSLCVACDSKPTCRPLTGTSANGPVEPTVAIAGRPFTLHAHLAATRNCHNGIDMASGHGVEVDDPEGAPLDTTVVARGFDPIAGELFADVSFTAAAPGLVHATVRFEPGLGTIQTLINVAEPSDAGRVDVTADQTCLEVSLRDDVLLCWHEHALAAIAHGHTVAELPIDFAAASAHRAWTVDAGVVSAWNLTDAGFALAAQLDLQTPNSVRLVANDDGALWEHGGIGELSLDSTGLHPRDIGHPTLYQVVTGYLQWVPGVGASAMQGNGLTGWCAVRYDGGPALEECMPAVGFAVASGSDGIWYEDGLGHLIVTAVLEDGGTRTATGFWAAEVLGNPNAQPSFPPVLLSDGGVFVPRVDEATQRVVLTSVGPFAGTAIGADDDCVYSVSGTQVTCWRRR